MKCGDVYLHICDNLDEDIHSERCKQIRQHLAECPDCSAYLLSLKKTIGLYRAMPPPQIPAGAHRELFRTITTLTGSTAQPKRRHPKKTKRT